MTTLFIIICVCSGVGIAVAAQFIIAVVLRKNDTRQEFEEFYLHEFGQLYINTTMGADFDKWLFRRDSSNCYVLSDIERSWRIWRYCLTKEGV